MFGSDDDAIMWINGQEVGRHEGSRGLERDADTIEVELAAGESQILAKNANRIGMWGIFMRFTSRDGESLDGLTFSPHAHV